MGFEHVNIAAAKRHGLVVTNTPYVLSNATAEVAIMLMVGAARRAGEEGVTPGFDFLDTLL